MIHPRNSNSNANSNSNFFIELYLHREITLHVLFEWPHTLSACSYQVSLYAWVCMYIRYWLACAYHLFRSFRRCFSLNSTFCGLCNQGGGGIHKVVILDIFNNNLCSSSLHGRDLVNAVVARWLDGKCQRLLATALKVQHCWTLKTTVGDCWRQSPTCAGDSRQLKYKHLRDCRRLSPSRATVSDWSINQAWSWATTGIHLYQLPISPHDYRRQRGILQYSHTCLESVNYHPAITEIGHNILRHLMPGWTLLSQLCGTHQFQPLAYISM